jgi:hypothetical protein
VLAAVAIAGVGVWFMLPSEASSTPCCGLVRADWDKVSDVTRKIAAQLLSPIADKRVSPRVVLVGAPEARRKVFDELALILSNTTLHSLPNDVAGVARTLGAASTGSCCAVLRKEFKGSDQTEQNNVLKSIFETGGVAGERQLQGRAAFVGEVDSEATLDEVVPPRVRHMVRIVTL